MKFYFRKHTEEDAHEISTWSYEGDYSFYSNNEPAEKKKWALNIHNEEDAYAIYNEIGELVGHCSFDNEDGNMILGVQMKPSLTGNGLGTEFVSSILEYGKSIYKYIEISLYVAEFNKRAIRLYEKLGFYKMDEFYFEVFDKEILFVFMTKYY